jgi:peptidoglycan/xylan/chitin deacetylase (PgdA/CDA1 family)
MDSYPRDLVGYGAEPPAANWPGGAKVAVQFVINYEEGGESSILHGDTASEAFLSEIVGAQAYPGVRHVNMESIYEYGSRAGFWRLHRTFVERQLPVTVYGVAMALERNPGAVAAMLDADWEIASHGYRWIDYQHVPEAVEREHLHKAIEIQTRLTGARPLGWYLGRCSPNTHWLVAEEGGFVYNADSYADDLPYWDTAHGLHPGCQRHALRHGPGIQQRWPVLQLSQGCVRRAVRRGCERPADDVGGASLSPGGQARQGLVAGALSRLHSVPQRGVDNTAYRHRPSLDRRAFLARFRCLRQLSSPAIRRR